MLREILARFGIRVNTAPLAAANTQIKSTTRSLGIMGGLLAGGLLVRGLQNFIRGQIDLGDETAKAARQLGIGAVELSSWRFAAAAAGVDAGSLTNGFRRLQRNIVDAGEGVTTAVRAFDSLGVAFRDAAGAPRELLDIIPEMADAFSEMESATTRSARAQQLFGRSGALLLPFFEAGSAGIEELLERFEELGAGRDVEFFQAAEVAQDALAEFDLTMQSLKATISAQILPVLSTTAIKVADLTAEFTSATRGTGVWKAALIALGSVAAAVAVAMVAAFITPIATIFLIAAAIFFVVVAVDDLITFLEGGESVIGDFFKSFGFNVELIRTDFRRFFAEQAQFWGTDFPKFLSETGRRLSTFGAEFAQFWGTDFPDAVSGAIEAVDQFLIGLGSSLDEVLASAAELFEIFNPLLSAVASARGLGLLGGTPAGARAPGVTARAGGAAANIEQTNQITIDARGGDPNVIERAVRTALGEGLVRGIRDAQRALTQLVE